MVRHQHARASFQPGADGPRPAAGRPLRRPRRACSGRPLPEPALEPARGGHRPHAGARLLVQRAGGQASRRARFPARDDSLGDDPFLGAYRNVRTRGYRELALANTDMFLAATERARMSLLLEGAADERISVCPPGIDTDRFRTGAGPRAEGPPMIISPGRLVGEGTPGCPSCARAASPRAARQRAGRRSPDDRRDGSRRGSPAHTHANSVWATPSSSAASSPTRTCPASTRMPRA